MAGPSGTFTDKLSWAAEARARLVALPTGRKLTRETARELGFTALWGNEVDIDVAFIHIGADVAIGSGTRIECERLFLGDMVTIGENVRIATRELVLSAGSLLGDRVNVDLAGGRHDDSALLVGPACVIGAETLVNTCHEVTLEEESSLSPRCMVFTHSYWQSALDGYSVGFRPVHIGPNAAVGAGTTIMPGVVVGSGAVIMANSTVLSEVPADTLVGGVPAVVLRRDIRRPLDRLRRRGMMNKVVNELKATLADRGCYLTTAEPTSFAVSTPEGRTFLVRISESEDVEPAGTDEIILALNGFRQGAGAGTVFDFAARVVSGPETPLVFEIRNLLRRFGIRFRPYAWRADYRKGI